MGVTGRDGASNYGRSVWTRAPDSRRLTQLRAPAQPRPATRFPVLRARGHTTFVRGPIASRHAHLAPSSYWRQRQCH